MTSARTSKQDFLVSKAENFKKYIYQFEPSTLVKDFVAEFSEDQLIPTIASKIIPLVSLGLVDETAQKLLAELRVPEDKKEEVQKKIGAYINMFATVLMQ
jgi:hypothetical protein